MKQKRTQKISLAILVIFAISAIAPSVITASDAFNLSEIQNEAFLELAELNFVSDEEAQKISERAIEIAEISQSWNLRSVKLKQDSTTKKPTWSFIWESNNFVKKVKIDYESNRLVSYLDTSASLQISESIEMIPILEREAIENAFKYIAKHYPELDGATSATICLRDDGYLVEIGRIVEGYPVQTDCVRVKINPWYLGIKTGFVRLVISIS